MNKKTFLYDININENAYNMKTNKKNIYILLMLSYLFIMAILLFIFFDSHIPSKDSWLLILFIATFILIVFVWVLAGIVFQREIQIDKNGISIKRALSKQKMVSWQEIQKIEHQKQTNVILLFTDSKKPLLSFFYSKDINNIVMQYYKEK